MITPTRRGDHRADEDEARPASDGSGGESELKSQKVTGEGTDHVNIAVRELMSRRIVDHRVPSAMSA